MPKSMSRTDNVYVHSLSPRSFFAMSCRAFPVAARCAGEAYQACAKFAFWALNGPPQKTVSPANWFDRFRANLRTRGVDALHSSVASSGGRVANAALSLVGADNLRCSRAVSSSKIFDLLLSFLMNERFCDSPTIALRTMRSHHQQNLGSAFR
jgi:hypothetical protein